MIPANTSTEGADQQQQVLQVHQSYAPQLSDFQTLLQTPSNSSSSSSSHQQNYHDIYQQQVKELLAQSSSINII